MKHILYISSLNLSFCLYQLFARFSIQTIRTQY